MSSSQAPHMLRIMPREMRLMTERILSLTGLPKGYFLTLQDVVMYSQKLDLGGFRLLEARFERLKEANPARISILSEDGSDLRLGAGGQHAWFVVPCLIDLLGELAQRFGTAHIAVDDVMDAAELEVVAPLAARSGLSVTFTDGDSPVVMASPKAVTGDVRRDEPFLWDLLQHGAPIEAELWWRIYHLAQKALTPDSVVSRRHAGPLIVNEDGTIIGRKDNDDETDISFLVAPTAGEIHSKGAEP